MNSLSVFGTSSDSGKSTITLCLGKIFSGLGYNPAPFKAQNMSNNSAVCDDGSEIGRAQYLQANSIGLKTSYHLNPVLIKPQGKGVSQLVLEGRVAKTISAKDYYKEIDTLKPYVTKAFDHLNSEYDFIIAEGAGSPVELNLTTRDLSNNFIASHYNTKIIIVADIERGGVFASIYGTYKLLEEKLRQNVIGVIINKFRGDMSLFDKGRDIIEKDFKIPVLGVIPFRPLNIDMEDSLSLFQYEQKNKNPVIRVALIRFPHISNYNDIDPLMADTEITIEMISSSTSLNHYDLVLLPGTKTTIHDLRWLKTTGLFDDIRNTMNRPTKSPKVFGICGGYQMMFQELADPHKVETKDSTTETGFGFIEEKITFSPEKRLKRGTYKIFGYDLNGYEIHCGKSDNHDLAYDNGSIQGSHIHGLFENDRFRTDFFRKINPEYTGYASYQSYKDQQINQMTQVVKDNLNVDLILQSLK